MRFDNLHAHDALMNQLPTWFKPMLEYIALMEAYGVALDGLNEQGQAIYYNQFIQTADADTLAVWEKLFGITLRYGDTLDFRRQRLLQKFNQIVPYTVWHLRDRLTELYGEDGYTLEVDPVACTISILVTSDRYGAIDLLYDLIWDVVPAHLAVRANQETTSYAVSDQYVAGILAKALVQNLNIRTVEKTVSGDIVSINDSAGFPAVDLLANIEPVQDLHGYDNPWPAGGMGNFADFADITYFELNGTITATVAADGSITINGANPSDKASFVRGLFHCPDQTATYTWATFNNVANSSLEFSVRTADFSPAGGWATLNAINKANTFTVDSGKTAVYWQIQIRTGATINNVTFKPMIVSGSTAPTTYAPYSNICPITGWDEVKVHRTGKNLYPYDTIPQYTYGWYSDYSFSGTQNKIFLAADTDYVLSFETTDTSQYVNLRVFDTSENLVTDNAIFTARQGDDYLLPYNSGRHAFALSGSVSYKWVKIRSTADVWINVVMGQNYAAATSPQLELGSTATAYEPYTGTDYTTDLPATVYGGTLDMTTGELVVDRAMVAFDGSEDESWRKLGTSSASAYAMQISNNDFNIKISQGREVTAIANYLVGVGSVVTWGNYDAFVSTTPTLQNTIITGIKSITTVADWRAYLASNPLEVCYELATPQTYQLSPQEVVMLAYNNTIWAECGPIVVTYKALEGDD